MKIHCPVVGQQQALQPPSLSLPQKFGCLCSRPCRGWCSCVTLDQPRVRKSSEKPGWGHPTFCRSCTWAQVHVPNTHPSYAIGTSAPSHAPCWSSPTDSPSWIDLVLSLSLWICPGTWLSAVTATIPALLAFCGCSLPAPLSPLSSQTTCPSRTAPSCCSYRRKIILELKYLPAISAQKQYFVLSWMKNQSLIQNRFSKMCLIYENY